jgi:tetratricopeptide (TPR) repeat protein
MRLIYRIAFAAALTFLWGAGGGVAEAQSLASDTDRREALAHYRAGQEFLSAEAWEKAAVEFERAIKLDALFTDAHFGRGQAYMGLKRYASAIDAFNGCLEAARTLHGLQQKDRVGVDRQINDELRELREQQQRLASLRGGGTLARATDMEQRIRELERSRSSVGGVFEPPATVSLSLGSAYFRSGNREAALRHWSDAVKVNPRLGEAWNNLAVLHLGAGEKARAEEAVKNAEKAGFRVNPRLKDDIKAIK